MMRRLLILAACCFFLPAFFWPRTGGGGGSGGNGGDAIQLVRTFTQANGATNNFWLIGQPYVSYPSPNAAEVPSGDAINVTSGATLGGTAIRVGTCAQKYDHAGDLSWADEMVDFSNASIAGSSGNLQLTSAPGSWNQTTTATDADWKALHDVVTVNPVSTHSTGGNDMNVGPYVATLDGTGGSTETITDLCDSPVGHMVKVVSTLWNSTNSINHCYLQAEMFYWVTENASGGHGIANSPIASWGPIVLNEQIFKTGTVHGGTCSGIAGNFYGMTVTWTRNGHQMRQATGVAIPTLADGAMARADGQWDWDDSTDFANNTINVHSDPQVVVTQTIPQVNATYKLPALWHQTSFSYTGGLVYSGSGASQMSYGSVPITAVGSAGLFTTPNTQNAYGTVVNPGANQGPNTVVAMQFTGSIGSMTGLHVNNAYDPTATVYWSCYQSVTTFYIYDNQSDAYACATGTGNGQIIPGNTTGYSGIGLNAEMAVAPSSPGMFFANGEGDGGNRPELSMLGEWSSAYLFGNSQIWQEQARTQAIAVDAEPLFAENDATQAIPSFLDSATNTSCCGSKTNMGGDTSGNPGGTGLGTPQTNTLYAFCTIYSGVWPPTGGSNGAPDGPCGQWSQVSQTHQIADGCFIVWMFEANPYCQQIIVGYGNEGAENASYLNARNVSNTGVGGGTTYYDVAGYNSIRGAAWDERDVGEAAFAAPQGSAEEAYFRQQLTNQAAFENAYIAWKETGPNSNFALWGQIHMDDTGDTCCQGAVSYMDAPYGSNFMSGYASASFSLDARLNGDYLPSFKTFADTTIKLQAAEIGGQCSWFSDLYNAVYGLSPDGATPPGAYGTAFGTSPNGTAAEQEYTFNPTTNEMTFLNPPSGVYSAEWLGGNGVSLAFQTGDEYVPLGSNPNAGLGANPPSSLTIGGIYYVINANISAGTVQLSTTPTGSAIPFGTSGGVVQTASSATWASNVLTVTTPNPNGLYYNAGLGGGSPVILSGFAAGVDGGPYNVASVSGNQFTVNITGSGAVSRGTVTPVVGGYFIPAGVTSGVCPPASAGGFNGGKNGFYGIQTAAVLCDQGERQNNATLQSDCTVADNRLIDSATIGGLFGSGDTAWAFQGTP